MAKPQIWFWQRIVSPHMAGLAVALTKQGCDVTYIAEQLMSAERASQGWLLPELNGVRLLMAEDDDTVRKYVESAPAQVFHICQGIRANGRVGVAQRELVRRECKQWAIMETVDDSGWPGILKRLEYRRLLWLNKKNIQGILSIGLCTQNWIVKRGYPSDRVWPFAYFLTEEQYPIPVKHAVSRVFRIAFVGKLIKRKRVQDIFLALAKCVDAGPFELWIVGDGPEGPGLREMGEKVLPGRIKWLGTLPSNKVSNVLSKVDLLILPSRHDGWGAVVSEALMHGTPAICSDRCGSAIAVKASGVGGVYRMGDVLELAEYILTAFKNGPVTPVARAKLVNWATALGAEHGAAYLKEVLSARNHNLQFPNPPWVRNERSM